MLVLILDTKQLALEVDDLAIARRLTEIATSTEVAMLADWGAVRGYDGMVY
ncbi:MAG TPA: hypothetical protein VL614_20645 [Acetobacteraceae bacterium]|nr:hypothetical protein [Acetobacteraceae bacterium]